MDVGVNRPCPWEKADLKRDGRVFLPSRADGMTPEEWRWGRVSSSKILLVSAYRK
jgi:hypothetical protein